MEKFRQLNEKFVLIPKLLYLYMAMLFYTFHQFRSVFIQSKFEVSNQSLGVYISIAQLSAFISNLWIGGFNDRTGRQRIVMVGLIITSAIFFQLFFAISSAKLFWVAFTIYFSLISATAPLLDKVIMDYLMNTPNAGPECYGTQRVWSSFGYLITNFVVERIIVNEPNHSEFDNMQYYNMVMAMLSATLAFLFINNLPPQRSRQNYLSSISKLLGNMDYIYLIFIVFLCGIVRASMTIYLSIYYKSVLELKNSDSKNGMPWPASSLINFFYHNKISTTTLFGVALEIVIFFNSARIVGSIGLFWPLFIAQFAQLFRFIGYYALDYENDNAFVYCCLLELLKGASFGLIQCAAVMLVTKLAPPRMRSTAQIIYTGTFVALGTVASGLIFLPIFQPNPKMPREQAYSEFRNVFMINIVISLAIIGLFFLKYAILENLLFSRRNVEEKLQRIETAMEEDEEDEAAPPEIPQGKDPKKVDVI